MIKNKLKNCFLLGCCMVIIALPLSACQSTPNENVVVNKADNDWISQSAPKQKYEAPNDWQEVLTYQNGQLTVNMSATVVVPDVDAYPIVRITPDKFNVDYATKLCEVLLSGKTLYVPDTVKTKDEIQDEILQLQKQISAPSSEVSEMKENNPEAYEQFESRIESEIEALEKQLEDAPDSYERQIAQIEFIQDYEDVGDTEGVNDEDVPQPIDRQVFSVETDLEKEIPTTLNIWTYNNDNRNYMEYLSLKDGENPVTDLSLTNMTENLRGVQITEEQAAEIANKAITGLGLNDMEIAASGSGIIENMELFFESGITVNEMPQSYVFYFTRSIQGIPTTFTDARAPKGDYMEPWPYEMIKVCVYDDGINEFDWVSPATVEETLSENVALLSFEKIQEIFKKQIEYDAVFTGYSDQDANIQRTIDIDRITLGMARIEEKDKPGQYLMIPVWDFFGSYTDQYPENYEDKIGLGLNEENQLTFSTFAHSFLTINAIDGSIIDRGAGY